MHLMLCTQAYGAEDDKMLGIQGEARRLMWGSCLHTDASPVIKHLVVVTCHMLVMLSGFQCCEICHTIHQYVVPAEYW